MNCIAIERAVYTFFNFINYSLLEEHLFSISDNQTRQG